MGKRTARAIGQHHGDLKRKLIEVATDLVEAGDVDFSLRELARHAGVTAAAPYHHFASKTAVLDEVAIAGFAGLDRAIASAISKADTPTTKLTQMVVAYLHFANTHIAHYQLMFPRNLGAGGDHRELRTVAELAFHRLLNAVRALRLHATEADLFFWAFSVWAVCHGYLVMSRDEFMDAELPMGTFEQLIPRIATLCTCLVTTAPPQYDEPAKPKA